MEKVRLYWFKALLSDRFDGERSKLMGATGLTKGRISQYLQDGFGDVAVRNLLRRLSERGHQLPADYFDRPIPEEGGQSTVTAFTSKQMLGLEDAIEMLADALGKREQKDREHLLDMLGRYAADPERQPATLEYLRQQLGGARDQQGLRRQN